MSQTPARFGRFVRLAGLGLLIVAMTALIAACGNDDDGPDGDGGGNSNGDGNGSSSSLTEVRSEVERAPSDPEAARATSAATRAFAADLYQVLARDDGNVVFSPYSAAVALAMTRAGAEGETAGQMDSVLHAAIAGDLHAGFNAIDQALAERPGEYRIDGIDEDTTADLALSVANQLFGQDDFEFGEDFLDLLAAEYGAGMQLIDYINAHEEARLLINDWVAERTHDRIPELIAEGILDDMTRLVLTNAIYLNAPWAHRFDENATSPAPFTLLDGDEVDAEMMRLSARINYGEGDGFQAVRLPYVDGNLSMIAVLPGDFASFEESLDAAKLDDIIASLGDAQVNLGFPKFEFRTQAPLKDALSEMGMPLAFQPGEADFTGIIPAHVDDTAYLQDVVHEAFISVDEHGTEAAAATAVVVGVVSAPPVNVDIDFDRPFLFLIHDQETGAILFMGRVLDPVAS